MDMEGVPPQYNTEFQLIQILESFSQWKMEA
jgi:hypothetical protein